MVRNFHTVGTIVVPKLCKVNISSFFYLSEEA